MLPFHLGKHAQSARRENPKVLTGTRGKRQHGGCAGPGIDVGTFATETTVITGTNPSACEGLVWLVLWLWSEIG